MVKINDDDLATLLEIASRASDGFVPFRDYNDSQLFDVFVWSEYPEVNSVVEAILSELSVLSGFNRVKNRKCLKTILLNLYIAYISGDKYVAYSRDRNAYRPTSRYGIIHVSYKRTRDTIDHLVDLGYIEHKLGTYKRAGAFENKISRMKATKKLGKHFEAITPESVSDHPAAERIILKDSDKNLAPYTDTRKTLGMRKRLAKLNELLDATDISLPLTHLELLDLNRARKKEGKAPIILGQKRLYRVFSNSSFTQHGRFYGGWWQSVPEEMRKDILINGGKTVERDYKYLHPTLLYIQETKHAPDGDCYVLEGHEGDPVMREVMKGVLLIILSAKNLTQAKRAMNYRFPRKLTDEAYELYLRLQADFFIQKLHEKHPAISKHFCSDGGNKLMYLDSVLADGVLTTMTKEQIPCLPIHDSFIVQERHGERLEQVMRDVFFSKHGVYPVID